jgi:ribosomal protein L16 Arg81 hydroxylase
MLYLPRGYWHATQFLDDASLHLTFAVQHPTGIDFMTWLQNRLGEEVAARKDIPSAIFAMPEVGEAAKQDYISQLRSLVHRSISDVLLDTFLAEYRATLGKFNEVQLVPGKRSDHAND